MMEHLTDLSALKIIEPVSYESNKQRLIDLITAISPNVVLYESSDEMVMLEAFAYEMTYRDESFNTRMGAVIPSLSSEENLDFANLNFYGVERLEGESDQAYYDRGLASLQISVATGTDDAYISNVKAIDSRITDVFPYRSGDGEVTIVWHSRIETDVEELTLIHTAIENIIFSTDMRQLCSTSQTVKRATVVEFDIEATLEVNSVFKKDETSLSVTNALREFSKGYKISQEVNLSKLYSSMDLGPVVVKSTITSPMADVVIDKDSVAVCRHITINAVEVQDV